VSRVAFVFPGQGARDVLGGVALALRTSGGERLLERALDAVSLDLPGLRAQAGRALERTSVLQPVLTAVCLAVHAVLRAAGVTPALVLGHSLGEVAAFAAAGAFSDEDAVALAAERGAAMEEAARAAPGGLLAVASMEEAQRLLAAVPGLELAAHNAPDEVVVCGSEAALAAAARHTSVRRVPVSGPWHSLAMVPAEVRFGSALARVASRPPHLDVLRNLDGGATWCRSPGSSPARCASSRRSRRPARAASTPSSPWARASSCAASCARTSARRFAC
jgi:[acyl-carrier-protein] S-malonyltransferase